jgi:hypothetical protein
VWPGSLAPCSSSTSDPTSTSATGSAIEFGSISATGPGTEAADVLALPVLTKPSTVPGYSRIFNPTVYGLTFENGQLKDVQPLTYINMFTGVSTPAQPQDQ